MRPTGNVKPALAERFGRVGFGTEALGLEPFLAFLPVDFFEEAAFLPVDFFEEAAFLPVDFFDEDMYTQLNE